MLGSVGDLEGADFLDHPHQLVFRTISEVAARGEPVDPLTVQAQLKQNGFLEQAGGPAFISGLLDGIPAVNSRTPECVRSYARRLKEYAARRQLLRISNDATKSLLRAGCPIDDVALDLLGATEGVLAHIIGSETRLVRLRDITPRPIEWLWEPYIPRGKLTLLQGDPGVGKSWISLALAARLSRGISLPGARNGIRGRTLLLSAEDDLADTIRPRLDKLNADTRQVLALRDPDPLEAKALRELKALIHEHNPLLVVVDPFVAFLSSRVDFHHANEVRAVTRALANLAAEAAAAIVLVHHMNKRTGGAPLHRSLGSIDVPAACRSVLLAGATGSDCAVVQVKNNLAPHAQSWGYEFTDGVFTWTGPSQLTAADLLAGERPGVSRLGEAREFLVELLSDGPVSSSEVYAAAEGAGMAKKTLRRAKDELGIIVGREGKPGKQGGGFWVWSLPERQLGDGTGLDPADATARVAPNSKGSDGRRS